MSLALVYSTNETYALKELQREMGPTCSAEYQQGGRGCFNLISAQVGWVTNRRGPWFGSLHSNLPALSADLVYVGDNSVPFPCGGASVCYNDYATYCLTNWIFTDWSGATHPFNGFHNCSNDGSYLYPFPAESAAHVGDSPDGSGYSYDLRYQNDPIVRGPDGTIYHFPAQPGDTVPGGNSASNEYNYYAHVFTSIVDRNNNTITAAANGQGGYTVTDTLGRQITVSENNLSWSDPALISGTPNVTIVQTGSALVPSPFPSDQACVANSNSYADGTRATISFLSAPPVPGSNTYTITIAKGVQPTDGTAAGYQYILTTDARDQITQAQYPTGGYTRYDIAHAGYITENEGDYQCTLGWNSVIAKHECSLASGGCSPSQPITTPSACVPGVSGGEATTCYGSGTSSPAPFSANWGALEAIDPNLGKTVYTFDPDAGPSNVGVSAYRPPLEANRQVYSSSGILLRTVTTSEPCTHTMDPSQEVIPTVPCSVTTALNDTSPALSSTKATSYWAADYVASESQTDFNGNVLTSLTNTYPTGGIYDPYGGTTSTTLAHVLDRVQQSVTTETVKGASVTLVNTLDSQGNTIQTVRTATNAPSATAKFQLDPQGEVIQYLDPMQVAGSHAGSTTFGYSAQTIGNCPQNAGPGLPTSITNALNQTVLNAYDGLGRIACTQDANGQVTQYSYEELGRTSEIDHPDGGQSKSNYAVAAPLSTTTSILRTGAQSVVQQTIADGLGRTAQQILVAPEGQICTETFFDPVGNVSAVNDSRLGCNGSPVSGASKSYRYDALNRKLNRTNEDGSVAKWAYSGSSVDFFDEVGNHTQRTADAFGRTTQVLEPDGNNDPTINTAYTYDGFGNLLSTNQNGITGEAARSRSFTYNGLSQLLTAQNPETGVICYGTLNAGSCQGGYDPNGNLLTKTDARGSVVSNVYDALNRLTGKHSTGLTAQAAGSSSCFLYDIGAVNGVGHLTAEWTQAQICPQSPTSIPASLVLTSKMITAYDAVGRILTEQICALSSCSNAHPQTYAYDLRGSLTSYTDGLGANTFTQTYDAAGRFLSASSSVTDQRHPANLLNITSYSPFGWTGATMGNALTLTQGFDSRERVTSFMGVHQ